MKLNVFLTEKVYCGTEHELFFFFAWCSGVFIEILKYLLQENNIVRMLKQWSIKKLKMTDSVYRYRYSDTSYVACFSTLVNHRLWGEGGIK